MSGDEDHSLTRCIVILPTWNEASNVRPLTEEILVQHPSLDVLVVDDNSPDGTGRIAREMSEKDPRVHVMIRAGQRGRGLAGIAGFIWAVEKGYDYAIEMDADFSHNPRHIPEFLEQIKTADVVIGSRLVPGGGETRQSTARRMITLLANIYIRKVLNVDIRDCTTGYRCFRHRALAAIGLEHMTSQGPSIVQEVLIACHKLGFNIIEMPILFEDRRAGQSTFNTRIMLNSLIMMWRFRKRWAKRKDSVMGS